MKHKLEQISFPEEKIPKIEEKLTERESRAYQDYATKKEGKEFSERVSEESYHEAQELINRLRNKDFDWLKIDWDKIDFNNASSVKEAELVLDKAVREVVNLREPDSKLSSMLRNSKYILPFIMSAAILLSPACSGLNSKETVAVQEKIEGVEKKPESILFLSDMTTEGYFSISSSSTRILEEWRLQHPEVVKIEASSKNVITNRKVEELNSDVHLKIYKSDGKILELHGSANVNAMEITYPLEQGLEAIVEKITGKDLELSKLAYLQELATENKALRSALESYE